MFCVLFFSEPQEPYLLYVHYPTYIQWMHLDGTEHATIYSGGRPYALDFDYRYFFTHT